MRNRDWQLIESYLIGRGDDLPLIVYHAMKSIQDDNRYHACVRLHRDDIAQRFGHEFASSLSQEAIAHIATEMYESDDVMRDWRMLLDHTIEDLYAVKPKQAESDGGDDDTPDWFTDMVGSGG